MSTNNVGIHLAVMMDQVVKNLAIKPTGIYVDATFGRGGHARKILEALGEKGILICIDKDPEAIAVLEKINDSRIIIRHGSFANLKSWIRELGLVGKVDGILLDLGVSSPQLDDPGRGFSFLQDGPLDMRMDLKQTLTAERWINRAKETELIEVFRKYGEERFSKRIARAIVAARAVSPITTTLQLADIVSKAHPRWEIGKHPATRVFQAVRIFINDELNEVKSCLQQCGEVLSEHGRLVVISFHSLEDQIVKDFIEKFSPGEIWSMTRNKASPFFQVTVKVPFVLKQIGKLIRPEQTETDNNPRARSARMRVMEKLD
jgi:16S rRNA (cytosine1402-N4)-methyltransferase